MTALQPLFISPDTKQVVFHSEEYSLKPPGIFQEVTGTSTPQSSMKSNEVILTSTENAQVWFDGIATLILDRNNEEVFRHGGVSRERLQEADKLHNLTGTALILGASGAHCYYHWMVDVLPKLKVLEAAGIDLDSIDHFIVRDLGWEHQAKSLELIGLPIEKIVMSTDKPNIRAELLYNVEIRNFVGMKMHPFIPEFLCEKFLVSNESNVANDRKIFIARPKGVNRPIENEDELLSFVTANGYEIVFMESMTHYEQAELFRSARSIITSHGGALTNIVYCVPGTEVIELFGAHVFSYYYGLANLCKLDYKAVLRSADQYDLVIDATKGNSLNNQNVTIREASAVNLAVLKRIFES